MESVRPNKQNKLKVLSISHTDLDGYASQYVINQVFSNDEITNVNLNYSDVVEFFKLKDLSSYNHIIITDLNLSYDIAAYLDTKYSSKLILIDHHDCEKRNLEFSWYNVNKDNSATLNAFNYFYVDEYYNIDKDKQKLLNFCKAVSAYDTWKIDYKNFNQISFISDVVYEHPMFFSKREVVFKYFKHIINNELILIDTQELEKDYIDFVNTNFNKYEYTKNRPTKHLLILSEDKLFEEHINNNLFYASSFNTYIGVCSIPSSNFQYLSSEFLRNSQSSKSIDGNIVLTNFSEKNKSGSCRSVNKKAIAVSRLFNGGGHEDAGGFLFEGTMQELIESLKE